MSVDKRKEALDLEFRIFIRDIGKSFLNAPIIYTFIDIKIKSFSTMLGISL